MISLGSLLGHGTDHSSPRFQIIYIVVPSRPGLPVVPEKL